MSGINYTVFVNPSGVARNIFILSSTEAGVTGQKVSAETKSVGPFELLARRVARENSSTNFCRVPSYSKRTRPRRREKVLPDYLPVEQAIQLPRVPYYVVSTRERERETRHFPRHLAPRIISPRRNIPNCYCIDFPARNCSTYNKYLTERIHRLK